MNFAYINVTNHSDADVSAKIWIDGHAGFPMQSVVATWPRDVIARFRAAGWTNTEVAAAAAQLPEFVLGDPVVMATERRAWSRSSTFRRREPGR